MNTDSRKMFGINIELSSCLLLTNYNGPNDDNLDYQLLIEFEKFAQ